MEEMSKLWMNDIVIFNVYRERIGGVEEDGGGVRGEEE